MQRDAEAPFYTGEVMGRKSGQYVFRVRLREKLALEFCRNCFWNVVDIGLEREDKHV